MIFGCQSLADTNVTLRYVLKVVRGRIYNVVLRWKIEDCTTRNDVIFFKYRSKFLGSFGSRINFFSNCLQVLGHTQDCFKAFQFVQTRSNFLQLTTTNFDSLGHSPTYSSKLRSVSTYFDSTQSTSSFINIFQFVPTYFYILIQTSSTLVIIGL